MLIRKPRKRWTYVIDLRAIDEVEFQAELSAFVVTPLLPRKEIYDYGIEACPLDIGRIGESTERDRLHAPFSADVSDQLDQWELRIVLQITHEPAVKSCNGIELPCAQLARQTVERAQIMQ